jgi:hypothetical protein
MSTQGLCTICICNNFHILILLIKINTILEKENTLIKIKRINLLKSTKSNNQLQDLAIM